MDNVVYLGCDTNVIIKTLEAILEHARKGKLSSVALTAILKRDDGDDYDVSHALILGEEPRVFTLMGGIKMLEYRLAESIENISDE